MAIRVAAALIYRDGRLLACQRREVGAHPLKWEFPGGKAEAGEGWLSALQRELREELGIEVGSATEILGYSHSYAGQAEVELKFFHVRDYQGPVSNRVFRQLRWIEVEQLPELDFLEGDRLLIEKLLRGEIPLES